MGLFPEDLLMMVMVMLLGRWEIAAFFPTSSLTSRPPHATAPPPPPSQPSDAPAQGTLTV